MQITVAAAGLAALMAITSPDGRIAVVGVGGAGILAMALFYAAIATSARFEAPALIVWLGIAPTVLVWALLRWVASEPALAFHVSGFVLLTARLPLEVAIAGATLLVAAYTFFDHAKPAARASAILVSCSLLGAIAGTLVLGAQRRPRRYYVALDQLVIAYRVLGVAAFALVAGAAVALMSFLGARAFRIPSEAQRSQHLP